MTHFLATAALLVSSANPLPKLPTFAELDGHGSATMGYDLDVFGEGKFRCKVYWGYCEFYWDGHRIEFSGMGAFGW